MKGENLTCGRIVMCCLGNRAGVERWRPAIVVETFDQLDPPRANLVVFADGWNDSLFGASAVNPTVWVSSVAHGAEPGHWLWPDELDEHQASGKDAEAAVAAEAPADSEARNPDAPA